MTEISSINNIVDISAGGYVSSSTYYNFCAAIKKEEGSNGQLFVWGYNGCGQFGFGNTTNLSAPTVVNLDGDLIKVASGAAHIAVLTSDGSVYIAGAKAAVQQSANQTTFTKIESDELFIDIAAGRDVTYFLTQNQKVYAIGAATSGSMLDKASSATPIKLFDSRVEAIFSGPEHYGCALSIPVEEE